MLRSGPYLDVVRCLEKMDPGTQCSNNFIAHCYSHFGATRTMQSGLRPPYIRKRIPLIIQMSIILHHIRNIRSRLIPIQLVNKSKRHINARRNAGRAPHRRDALRIVNDPSSFMHPLHFRPKRYVGIPGRLVCSRAPIIQKPHACKDCGTCAYRDHIPYFRKDGTDVCFDWNHCISASSSEA